MQVLTSPRNPLLKEVRRAVSRGGLTDSGFCVAEGIHLLEEALRSGCEVAAVLTTEAAGTALDRHLNLTTLPDDLFRSIATTENSQGVIALVRPPAWTIDDLFRGNTLTVVLDGIQDPGNAGTILRSAEAFGATGVMLLKGSVNPFNSKCVRASAGSVFRVPMITGADPAAIPSQLKMFALVPGQATDIARVDFTQACALIVGSEAHGVSGQIGVRATPVAIPTSAVESLNAATAAAIALYEARRQRTAAA